MDLYMSNPLEANTLVLMMVLNQEYNILFYYKYSLVEINQFLLDN